MVRINGLFHLLINGVYWGYNPLINPLLTSWDILVCVSGGLYATYHLSGEPETTIDKWGIYWGELTHGHPITFDPIRTSNVRDIRVAKF